MDPDQPAAKRARNLSPEEQEIIINVYKYVKRSLPQTRWPWCPPDETEESTETTGLMKPAVYDMVHDRRRSRRRPISDMIDEQTLTDIRRKIYHFFQEVGHGVPTPENILRDVNDDERLPNFAMPTFRRVLRHLHYRHVVTRNRSDDTSRCETFSIPVV